MSEWNGLFTCQNFQLLHFNTVRPCLSNQTVSNDLERRSYNQTVRQSDVPMQHNPVNRNRVTILVARKASWYHSLSRRRYSIPLVQQTTPRSSETGLTDLKLVLQNPPVMNYFQGHFRQGHCSDMESLSTAQSCFAHGDYPTISQTPPRITG